MEKTVESGVAKPRSSGISANWTILRFTRSDGQTVWTSVNMPICMLKIFNRASSTRAELQCLDDGANDDVLREAMHVVRISSF